MPGQGRTIGIILIAIAVVVLLASVVWLLAEPATGAGGKALGLLLVLLVLVLPLGGGGVYLLTKGRQESAEYAEIAKQKKILNMVLAQGKVTLSEVALELNTPMDQVEDYGARPGGQEPVQRRDQLEGRRALLQAGLADEGRPEVPQLRRPGGAGRQGRDQVPVLRVGSIPGELRMG